MADDSPSSEHEKRTGVNLDEVNTGEGARSFIISTNKEPVYARKVCTAKNSSLNAGQMADETAQKLSTDAVKIAEIAASSPGTSRCVPSPNTSVDHHGALQTVGGAETSSSKTRETLLLHSSHTESFAVVDGRRWNRAQKGKGPLHYEC